MKRRNLNQLGNQNRIAIGVGILLGVSVIISLLPEPEVVKEPSFTAEQRAMLRSIKAASCDMTISSLNQAELHEDTAGIEKYSKSAKENKCFDLSSYR